MDVEARVKQTISKYKLIDKKDKILVAVSGGKDSLTTAYLLKKFKYNVEGVHIHLGMGEHSNTSLKKVEEFCNKFGISLHIYYISKEAGKTIPEIIKENEDKNLSSCMMCGVFKKWLLNKKARELKVNKIATGHHMNDGLETFLINILKGSPQLSSNFSPILKVKDKKFVVRIKPLFFVPEEEIRKYAKKKGINFSKEICPYRGETYRVEIRNFLKSFSIKEKEKMMNGFMKLSEKIKKEDNLSDLKYCEICGEPTRKNICRKCELIKE
jgi:uncharacterized protein (TIGR00269 family)